MPGWLDARVLWWLMVLRIVMLLAAGLAMVLMRPADAQTASPACCTTSRHCTDFP